MVLTEYYDNLPFLDISSSANLSENSGDGFTIQQKYRICLALTFSKFTY